MYIFAVISSIVFVTQITGMLPPFHITYSKYSGAAYYGRKTEVCGLFWKRLRNLVPHLLAL